MREKSDYNCVYVTTADEMQPLFEPVREFIAKVGNCLLLLKFCIFLRFKTQ